MKPIEGAMLLADKGFDHFKGASAFGAISEPAITFLLERGQVWSLDDGDILFRAGDTGESFFIVVDGRLDYVREKNGQQVVIRNIEMGEQLGYVSMIGLFERFGMGRANGAVVVIEIKSDLFYQLHLDFPFDFGILMLNLSRDMARTIRFFASNLTAAYLG